MSGAARRAAAGTPGASGGAGVSRPLSGKTMEHSVDKEKNRKSATITKAKTLLPTRTSIDAPLSLLPSPHRSSSSRIPHPTTVPTPTSSRTTKCPGSSVRRNTPVSSSFSGGAGPFGASTLQRRTSPSLQEAFAFALPAAGGSGLFLFPSGIVRSSSLTAPCSGSSTPRHFDALARLEEVQVQLAQAKDARDVLENQLQVRCTCMAQGPASELGGRYILAY